MPITYEPIATTTLGTAAASVTFSSISATYTDLVLIANMAQTSGTDDFSIRFNGDTGNNYSRTVLHGSGSAAGSNRNSSAAQISISYYGYPPSAASTFGAEIIHILNYSNTTTYKTVLARANSASTGTDATVGLWRNTAAINEVIIRMNAGTIATGSTITLFGIKAA
jgi:hypothetical protein